MPIPTIHVGCRRFGLGRLQALVNCEGLEPVACVDIAVDEARQGIKSLQGNVPPGLPARVYPSITEARRNHPAQLCLIYATTTVHAQLIVESLDLGLHTMCVKPIACTQDEFRKIMAAHRARPDLMLVQGHNNRWNPAAAKMREWLQGEQGIGDMLGGECRLWIRQNLRLLPGVREPDAFVEGLFFHSGMSHQIDQLVAAKGLPQFATARVHQRTDPELDQTGVWGTAGGQALLEYANGASFCYTGTRAAHADPFGLGSRWSGHWTIHGERGDLRRDGGHLQLFRNGRCVQDWYLQDLHPGLVEDDRIQFDAVAAALTTGAGRRWLEETTLGTWILMEACNESARTVGRIDLDAFRARLLA